MSKIEGGNVRGKSNRPKMGNKGRAIEPTERFSRSTEPLLAPTKFFRVAGLGLGEVIGFFIYIKKREKNKKERRK